MTCPNCGSELSGDFPFCPHCGTRLTRTDERPRLEERKVVSVLFCDLVGFTAASEHADPEDVRARLQPYHQQLSHVIESHGGTVEKFVGDAVMAVFGAPVAHEDDAERAVRAGLRILEAIDELNQADSRMQLQVKIGINTGEAVVSVGAHPERGEAFVTGDVVNTASRLQQVAPLNGVAASEATFRQTERAITYVRLEPAQVKGKTDALAAWQPLAARGRFGTDVVRTHTTPLVGRELERALLIATFERTLKQRACQLVTVVGEPGVGKTRLCAELARYIEQRPGLTRWRQGRSLPYGEGIAFWPLGEIVKAHCGILDSDSPDDAWRKLGETIAPDQPDRAWLMQRLGPLIGVGGEPAAQDESFTAWRRFLEGLAAQNPTVLVFEDLHWADEAMLAFLEHLADWSEEVPLLLLCTARPELQEKHPTWSAGLRNAQTITLAPLSDDETATLFAALSERTVLPAATQRALLDRAGGNPLYAEEFVRLLSDRELLSGSLEDIPFPDSVHALIAARLDTLSAERKSLLQDAAVVGKVFWTGAVATMGARDPRDVELELHELVRKELVRPARSSSIAGEREYSFWHLLVRDVCYAQIPRPGRIARHRAAAQWIEEQAGERVDDMADVLAHHYMSALELARAAGHSADIPELESAARRQLALAGSRALAIDVNGAELSFSRALELAPAGHPDRAGLLERWAQAAQQQGRTVEAKAALEEALALYREQNDQIAVARVLVRLSSILRWLGDPARRRALAEALTLLEAEEPGPELVTAYGELSAERIVDSAFGEASAAAERAIDLATRLGLPESARALSARGYCRAYLQQAGGLDDMRRAVDVAIEQGRGRDAALLHNNLAMATWPFRGPAAALEICREGIAFCERRGIAELTVAISAMQLSFLAACGRSQDVLDAAPDLIARSTAGSATWAETLAAQLVVLSNRGEEAPVAELDQLIAETRPAGEPEVIANTYATAAAVLLRAGDVERVDALLGELAALGGKRGGPYYSARVTVLVRAALERRNPEIAARLMDDLDTQTPLQHHALTTCRAAMAEARGDHAAAAAGYADAAARWREFGDISELAEALLGQGRCMVALGFAQAATGPLREAAQLFREMGYESSRAQVDALLHAGTSAVPD